MAEKSDKHYHVSTSKLLRTSFALDKRYAEMSTHLRKKHGAVSQTDYIKGLIAFDWLAAQKEPLEITQIPAWVIVAYKLEVSDGKVSLGRKIPQ